ncbi:MAG: 4Fe-4S binding protein [Coriobacteriales bacterium]|jgi:NAD-dependent dihydropyrimidine dehydrogenase PreA subunit|nr:4Fe-4S binding protein [Coriobacteriales bacterium]
MAISIDDETCSACASCVDACPLGLIELKGPGAAIEDKDSCIECAACVDTCPVGAIAL